MPKARPAPVSQPPGEPHPPGPAARRRIAIWTVTAVIATGLLAAAIVLGTTHDPADADRPRLHATWTLTANQPASGCSDLHLIGTDTTYRLCAEPPSCARRTLGEWQPVDWTPEFAATYPNGEHNPAWSTNRQAFNCTIAAIWLTAQTTNPAG